ncbi:MAG: hypothetical protein IT338_01550 [Thermomicrobiales bacterium]|nr:hypothetical protein [Thermomicrobiales bacterium]
MDTQHFDQIASSLARAHNRRGVMALLGAAVLGGSAGLLLQEEGAARRKKSKKKGKGRCLKSGKSCRSDKQCCGKQGLICDVPQNASNSDTECCGGKGATCGGVDDEGNSLAPFCCVGQAGRREFVCSQNDPNNPFVKGTCMPAPPDE